MIPRSLVAACLITTGAMAAYGPLHDFRAHDIQAFLDEIVAEQRAGGAAAIVTIDGEPIFSGMAGTLAIDGDQPITSDSIYRIFSMTKPITSVATMICYEEGLFMLGDPVSRYLPEFTSVQVVTPDDGSAQADTIRLEPAHNPVTIRDLLLHTSGMYYFEGIPAPLLDQLNSAVGESADLADLSRRLATLPLAHEPGERWTYGISPAILGRLVEVVSGMPFGEFCRTRIFEPLDMPDTGFAPTRPEQLVEVHFSPPTGNLPATNQSPLELGPALLRFTHNGMHRLPALEAGDGGMFSTLRDYERFVRMLMQDGELEGTRILSPAVARYMRTSQLPEAMGCPPWFDGDVQHGLNLFIVPETGDGPAGLPAGSFLGGGAATTAWFADPQRRGVAVFMTARLPTDNPMANRFVRLASEAMDP